MRIRCKPWARPELEKSDFFIPEPDNMRGKWQETFKKEQPIWLEVGCGKGGFISQIAPCHPEINFIAMDIKNEMLVLAKRKIESAYKERNLDFGNIRIAIKNISEIENTFDKCDDVEKIFINFCNPWPRRKHKKRRLTHPRQLEQYLSFLKSNGEIVFKTDDDDLFYESMIYFYNCGFNIKFRSFDIFKNPPKFEDYKTEHEKMFESEGKSIKMLVAVNNK